MKLSIFSRKLQNFSFARARGHENPESVLRLNASGVATGGRAPNLDSEIIAKNRGKGEENQEKEGKSREKEEKFGRFFHFAASDR